MENYAFIYKCSFFESEKHTVSHTDMYYNEEKHTRWVHCTRDYTTVSVIRVLKNSEEYKSAIKNSQQENELVEESEEEEEWCVNLGKCGNKEKKYIIREGDHTEELYNKIHYGCDDCIENYEKCTVCNTYYLETIAYNRTEGVCVKCEKKLTYEYFMKKFMDGCKEIQWMDGKEEKFRKEWELFKMFNDDEDDEQYFYDYICDKIEEYQNKKYITTLILN